MIYDEFNKGWSENQLYLGKPFVFYDDGWTNYRRMRNQFFRWGRMTHYDIGGDIYRIKWYADNANPTYVTYTYKQLMNNPCLHYGYVPGQKVIRVTDGGERTIKSIHANDFSSRVEEEEGGFSYDLFIPCNDIIIAARYEPLSDELFEI